MIKRSENKLLTIICVILPLIRYRVPGISALLFSDVAILFSFLYVLLNQIYSKTRIVICKPCIFLLLFWVYLLIITLCNSIMSYANLGQGLSLLLRQTLQLFYICFLIPYHFDKDYGFKVFILISMAISILVIIQFVLFVSIGLKTSFILPFLQADGGYNNSDFIAALNYRPAGIFFEPSDYAYYVLFALLISLFWRSDGGKIRFFPIVIISLGMVFSQSTTAIICMFICYGFFVWNLLKTTKIKIGYMLVVLVLLSGVIGLSKTTIFKSVVTKISSINTGSAAVRVLRGFVAYGKCGDVAKIFGVGLGNYSDYLSTNGIITQFDYIQEIGITNSISQYLVETGAVGTLLILSFYINLMVHTRELHRYITFLLLFLGFFTGVLTNVNVCLFLALSFLGYDAVVADRQNEDINSYR